MSQAFTNPWVLIGDMNNVLSQANKKEGRPYPNWLIQGFQKVLDECGLTDLNLNGYPYTWERKHGKVNWIEVRLERALASPSFINTFKDANLINLEISTLDHTPILLEIYKVDHIAPVKNLDSRTRG